MLIISALSLAENDVGVDEIECALVDYASVVAAEINGESTFEGCDQTPAFSISLKPAEDMVIPIFVCRLHFNAIKLSIKEGIAIGESLLDI